MSTATSDRPIETVWKYPLSLVDVNELKVPHGAQFLHVGIDPTGDLCLWARVNTSSPEVPVKVYVVGTGNPVPMKAHVYLGTAIGYPYVWHVFTEALSQTLVKR